MTICALIISCNLSIAQYYDVADRNINVVGIVPMNRVDGRAVDFGDTKTDSLKYALRNTIKIKVDSFSQYFDDKLVDSFFAEFKNFSQKSNTEFIHFESIERTYLVLFKAVYGDSFKLEDKQLFLIIDTALRKRSAQILCKARSSKSGGLMDISFAVGKDNRIALQKMNFTPFDHAQNAFIHNLSEGDLELIRAKQGGALMDTVLRYADAGAIPDKKATSRKVQNMKLPPTSLFTSRLFIQNSSVWVIGIYDTDKSDERLLLGYKLIDKKFKPALVNVLFQDNH